jgi:hypothetical protein
MSRYLSETKMFKSVGILLHVEFAASDSSYKNYGNRQRLPLFHQVVISTGCKINSTSKLLHAVFFDWAGVIGMSLYILQWIIYFCLSVSSVCFLV